MNKKKIVITYGTFDLFHQGHFNILKRAKELGDYLIVGVTTDNYDISRGKLNVQQPLSERINNVRESGLADEIIIEEHFGQKVKDIQEKNVDIFAIGDDWRGKFDYLNEYCEVIYFERTKNVSSTMLREEKNGLIRLGIIGNGRIAKRFISESKFVSGVTVDSVYGVNENSVSKFANEHGLTHYVNNFDEFLNNVDAVYIASPHSTHYQYSKEALLKGKHVMCEKPITLDYNQTKELYEIAEKNKLVLIEAIKTAYAPGFIRLLGVAKSGLIGNIVNIDANFTKLTEGNIRELQKEKQGGSFYELASYPLMVIIKLLGTNYTDVNFYSYYGSSEVDLFTKFNVIYDGAIATGEVGLGVKTEGDLVISGTKGYIYVPSPWWKTEYFEIRYEDFNKNEKHVIKFEGDGLRYELAVFTKMITGRNGSTIFNWLPKESICASKIISDFENKNITI